MGLPEFLLFRTCWMERLSSTGGLLEQIEYLCSCICGSTAEISGNGWATRVWAVAEMEKLVQGDTTSQEYTEKAQVLFATLGHCATLCSRLL